jgi:hypothetical protein
MTRLATVFAAALLIFAGNVRNINAAVKDNWNPDVPDFNVVLDAQDLNNGADGVVFTVNNRYLNVDADRFLNVEDNRGLNVIENGNDNGDANLGNSYFNNSDGFDSDGGNLFDVIDLPSDIRG